MHINGKQLRTIWFDQKDQVVKIIDQTKLPHKFIIKDLKTAKDAINAIKTMEVRGAPLIGATAAYGIVLSIMEKNDPANNCLDTAIITNPKLMTAKTKRKLKNIAGRVLFKK